MKLRTFVGRTRLAGRGDAWHLRFRPSSHGLNRDRLHGTDARTGGKRSGKARVFESFSPFVVVHRRVCTIRGALRGLRRYFLQTLAARDQDRYSLGFKAAGVRSNDLHIYSRRWMRNDRRTIIFSRASIIISIIPFDEILYRDSNSEIRDK